MSWACRKESTCCPLMLASVVVLSLTPARVETIPWMASRTVSPGALWPRLCRHKSGPRASPRQSLRCWGPTNGPSTPPADRLGTMSPGPPSKRRLLLVRHQATAFYFCTSVVLCVLLLQYHRHAQRFRTDKWATRDHWRSPKWGIFKFYFSCTDCKKQKSLKLYTKWTNS